MKRSTLPPKERAERIITVPSDSLELAAGRRYSLLERDGRYEIWDVRTQREVVSYTEGAGQLAWARYQELEQEAGLTGASRGAAHGAWGAIVRNWEIAAVFAAVAIAALVLVSDLRKDTLVIDTTVAAPAGPSDAEVADGAGLGAAGSVLPSITSGTDGLEQPDPKPDKKPWEPDHKRNKPDGNGGNAGQPAGDTGTSGSDTSTSGSTGGDTGGNPDDGNPPPEPDPPGSGNDPPSPPPPPVEE